MTRLKFSLAYRTHLRKFLLSKVNDSWKFSVAVIGHKCDIIEQRFMFCLIDEIVVRQCTIDRPNIRYSGYVISKYTRQSVCLITPSEILVNVYCIKSTFTIGLHLQYCSAHEAIGLRHFCNLRNSGVAQLLWLSDGSFPGSLVTPHPWKSLLKELYYHGLVKIRYQRNAFSANDRLRCSYALYHCYSHASEDRRWSV